MTFGYLAPEFEFFVEVTFTPANQQSILAGGQCLAHLAFCLLTAPCTFFVGEEYVQ